MVKQFKKYRTIDGKTWTYSGNFLSKKKAEEIARIERRGGRLARVFAYMNPKRFVVYTRKKQKKKSRRGQP